MFFFLYIYTGWGGKGIPNLTCGLKIYPFPHRLSVFVDVLSSLMCKLVLAARGYSGQGLCDSPGGVFMCGEHFSPRSFLLLLGVCAIFALKVQPHRKIFESKFKKKNDMLDQKCFPPTLIGIVGLMESMQS